MVYCSKCGFENNSASNYCSKCGQSSQKSKPVSKLWYILPLILGFIGGIVSFLILLKRDHIMAIRCLVIGLAETFIAIILAWMYPGIF